MIREEIKIMYEDYVVISPSKMLFFEKFFLFLVVVMATLVVMGSV
jgi:hypothetical protein